jgi:prophage DNA circulation protein
MLANYNATQTLMRRVTLVQAAGMVANMSLPVYDDALSLKSKLLTALDDEAAVANDDVYLALNNVRSKAFIDVNAKIKNSARINTVQPKEVTPALVLAYDLYEDVARESEIVSRNKLRHPGFTPAIGIKVLSV